MKARYNFYTLTRKIHLYAALSTVALLLMYIVTSYLMIHHNWFQPHNNTEQVTSIKIEPSEVSEENWDSFRKKHDIKGRLTRERFNKSGDLYREYESAGTNSQITIFNDKDEVEIKIIQRNLAGSIIGFHRMSGYGGPIQYNIYALLLDIVGIGLIIFAVTGVIMWLKILKQNIIAWIILISGFVYVSLILGYLLLV